MAKPIRSAVALNTDGLAEVAALAQQRTLTMKAVKAGAKLIQKAAKSRAPRRKGSGALRQSIGVKAAKGSRGKTLAYAVIGPRKSVEKMVPVGKNGRTIKAVPAYYAHLVEKGTRAHSLGAGAKLVRRGKTGAAVQHGRKHPGAKAQPFLGPAFDAEIGRAEEAARDVLAAGVRAAMVKAAAKIKAK